MFKSIIDKVGTFLKVACSCKRVHSPNSTSKAKTQQGYAGATSGDHSPLHIGDAHHYYAKKETRETTSYTKSWETLLNTFSHESAQRLVRMIFVTEMEALLRFKIPQTVISQKPLKFCEMDNLSSAFFTKRCYFCEYNVIQLLIFTKVCYVCEIRGDNQNAPKH